jgi:hypothetical protein
VPVPPMSVVRVHGTRLFAVPLMVLSVLAACSSDGGIGPDAFRPQFYDLQFVDNTSLPAVLWTDAFGGRVEMQSATLVPYAVGRTIDQRLINDRTGRGSSGGNTRDTSVARGQMMDIRILRQVSSIGEVTFLRDSLLVDVEVRDTVFVVSRPHPDPARVRVDTGYFVDALLIIPTLLDYNPYQAHTPRNIVLSYRVTR